MKRLIVERNLRVKELWELPEDYDIEQPLHLQGWQLSQQSILTSPVTYRPYQEGESLEPSLTDRAISRAEVGYWRRLMQAYKDR